MVVPQLLDQATEYREIMSRDRAVSSGPVGVLTGVPVEAWIVNSAARRQGLKAPLMAVAALGDADLTFRRTARLIAEGAKGLVSFGLAGGLDSALSAGDVVLPREIHADGQEHACESAWIEALQRRIEASFRVSTGPLTAVARPVQTVAEKSALRERSGAAAVDMESGIVARAAQDRGLPFISVRVIADPAAQDLPHAAVVAIGGNGELHLGRVAAALWREPRDISDLLRIARQFAVAIRALSAVCRLVGPRFGLP